MIHINQDIHNIITNEKGRWYFPHIEEQIKALSHDLGDFINIGFGITACVYQFSNDRSFVLKIYRPGIEHNKIYSLNDLDALENLQGINSIPKLYYGNHKYVMYEFINGNSLKDKEINLKNKDSDKFFEKYKDFCLDLIEIYKRGYSPDDTHGENILITKDFNFKIIDVGSFIKSTEIATPKFLYFLPKKYRSYYEKEILPKIKKVIKDNKKGLLLK